MLNLIRTILTAIATMLVGCASVSPPVVEGTVLPHPMMGVVARGTATLQSSGDDEVQARGAIARAMVDWCNEKGATPYAMEWHFRLNCSSGEACSPSAVKFDCVKAPTLSVKAPTLSAIEDSREIYGWKGRGVRSDLGEALADIVRHGDLADSGFTSSALGMHFKWPEWIDACRECQSTADHLVPIKPDSVINRFEYEYVEFKDPTLAYRGRITLAVTYAACFEPDRLTKGLDTVRLSYEAFGAGEYPQGYLLLDRPDMDIFFVNRFSECGIGITQVTKKREGFSGPIAGTRPTRECSGSPNDPLTRC